MVDDKYGCEMQYGGGLDKPIILESRLPSEEIYNHAKIFFIFVHCLLLNFGVEKGYLLQDKCMYLEFSFN